jgi:hypothetical protein
MMKLKIYDYYLPVPSSPFPVLKRPPQLQRRAQPGCHFFTGLATSAPRFESGIFAALSAAGTTGTTTERLSALPALALLAGKWPLQPVVTHAGKVVCAIDEALLIACAAAADLDSQVLHDPPL